MIDSEVRSRTRILKVTPGQLDQAQDCLYRAQHTFPRPEGQRDSFALRRGKAIHDLLQADGKRALSGQRLLDPVDLVQRGCMDTELKADAAFVSNAVDCMLGARAYISARGLTLLAVERFEKSSPRDVTGAPGLQVVFSGRIDLVACTPDGAMLLLDYKTGRIRILSGPHGNA